MKTIIVKNLSELKETAKQILSFAQEKKIICFYGDLGAGKTTLIKEICKQLGMADAGSSPTFALINEYSALPFRDPNSSLTVRGPVLYHFDLYRLKFESEIYDIGYEEYLYSGNYCFIEWPEKMEHLLPHDFIKVEIKVEDTQRIISLS
jgi:tRNA threonylcarbamoyladenosine biosynthesis protein TsaE